MELVNWQEKKWCQYYFEKFGVDVRSIRYPGLISHKVQPGGGTTDYAMDIFLKAVSEKSCDCFLRKDTTLPMMYIDDAIIRNLNVDGGTF